MKIKCEYCGNFISDTDERCPYCNGVNSHLVRNAGGVPKTIEELNQWCKDKNIPLEQARFFIGVDYRGARAFGIYKDEQTGNFIVYKNKSDGSRAIRYEGKDEAYAVNEIYQKLKEEIINQRQHQRQREESSHHNNHQREESASPNHINQTKSVGSLSSRLRSSGILIGVIIVIVAIILLTSGLSHGPKRGYYEYANQIYYYQPSDGWYTYDYGDWSYTTVDYTLEEDYKDYYSSGSYYSGYDVSDFSDSHYYEDDSSNHDSNDDDSSNYDSYDDDWDSGWDYGDSWDSGYSDWDSDW